MRCAIHMPMNAEDLTIELMMVAYGNWQNAIKFARANNSNLLRALKQWKPGFTLFNPIYLNRFNNENEALRKSPIIRWVLKSESKHILGLGQ